MTARISNNHNSRGSNNPTIAAGLTHWRSMNATQRREAVLQAIRDITAELGMPPLRRELANKCGMDLKTVRRYLKDLEDEGLVVEPGGPGTRTLRCVDEIVEDAVEASKGRPRKSTRSKSEG